jgi:hypothetical protein
VDCFLKNPKENYFESISAGSDSPREGIVDLINDGNVVDHQKAGHRLHLLGISDFHSKSLDIGIGWATNPNSPYKTYLKELLSCIAGVRASVPDIGIYNLLCEDGFFITYISTIPVLRIKLVGPRPTKKLRGAYLSYPGSLPARFYGSLAEVTVPYTLA